MTPSPRGQINTWSEPFAPLPPPTQVHGVKIFSGWSMPTTLSPVLPLDYLLLRHHGAMHNSCAITTPIPLYLCLSSETVAEDRGCHNCSNDKALGGKRCLWFWILNKFKLISWVGFQESSRSENCYGGFYFINNAYWWVFRPWVSLSKILEHNVYGLPTPLSSGDICFQKSKSEILTSYFWS